MFSGCPWFKKILKNFNTFLRKIPGFNLYVKLQPAMNYKSLHFTHLGVACWPLIPKFTGSNPAKAIGSLRAKNSSACLPLEGK